jgi:transposase
MKIDQEGKMTIKHLCSKGVINRQVARLLCISEGVVCYHRGREHSGEIDGRSRHLHLAEGWSEAITHYIASLGTDGPINLAVLHDWLVSEHDYPGSRRSVQRYYRKHFPKPCKRARRRVETPPGAQAQVDWDEYKRIWVGGRPVRGYRFHMKLSHSRMPATVWSARKDQLSWLAVHNEAFRRLEGVPATLRVDNVKTAVAKGTGPWGELTPSYRRMPGHCGFTSMLVCRGRRSTKARSNATSSIIRTSAMFADVTGTAGSSSRSMPTTWIGSLPSEGSARPPEPP